MAMARFRVGSISDLDDYLIQAIPNLAEVDHSAIQVPRLGHGL